MPFKSKSQLRKFQAMVRRGEMDAETLEKWIAETEWLESLPERVPGTNKQKRKRRQFSRDLIKKKYFQQYKQKGRPYITRGRRITIKKV